MSDRAFLGSAFGLAAVSIGSYLSLCLVIDPFNLYHAITPQRYISGEERLAKWAVAHSPEHDSYFIGGSMSEELSIADFNRAFDAHFACLTLSGGTSYEQLNMLKQLPPGRSKVLVLDAYYVAYMAESNEPRYPAYPHYLYDNRNHHRWEAYLMLNPFMLRELVQAWHKNFRGVDIVPEYIRVTHDGYMLRDASLKWRNAPPTKDKIYIVRTLPRVELKLYPDNIEAIMALAASRFDQIYVYFPPVHAESLRVRLLNDPGGNLRSYLLWKKRVIDAVARVPQAVLIDYQTINRYTVNDENYWDFNHFRANVNRMIYDDFVSWRKTGRLAHPDFGQIADAGYGRNLSAGSFFFPRDPSVKGGRS
jgi:hypothetical protein